MRTFKITRLSSLFLLFAFAFSCTDHVKPACRITKFYWEGQWHQAYYNEDGRLTTLHAPTSKIVFYYDESSKLVKAEVYTVNPDPTYRYEFVHGPFGIIETNFFYYTVLGEERNRAMFHYASPDRVDYIIFQEYGIDVTPGFEIRDDITYSGGNVKSITGTSTVINTAYYGISYDKNENPFRALASAVGNPVFFPVCRMANFPVADYDISLLSLFSKNNPLRAEYKIPGAGLDPEVQSFTYSYASGIAKEIKWSNSSYGSTSTEVYKFEFACGKF